MTISMVGVVVPIIGISIWSFPSSTRIPKGEFALPIGMPIGVFFFPLIGIPMLVGFPPPTIDELKIFPTSKIGTLLLCTNDVGVFIGGNELTNTRIT